MQNEMHREGICRGNVKAKNEYGNVHGEECV